ncbi:uncharacterized protein LOC114534672 [Dendronephthya gigantea]|uniref:uncharacterized protein LOC114534672 n=1 Tax=Dendronephthya gigantea TaxID=151771 RepID=UPI00106B1E76|nr:uncharacterized protein LOC114534672 [Dendronephthya gigantea]
MDGSLQGNEVISGSGPIWLTEVDCTGEEENLTQCSNAGWGNSNCAHSEDAGVQCATTEKPNVRIDCPSQIAVHQGDKVTCLCRGEGGIPSASVKWYKGNIQIGVTGKEEQKLVLQNVVPTDGGIYKCVALSNRLKDEKSIEVLVLDKVLTTSPPYTTIQSATTKVVVISPSKRYDTTIMKYTPTSSTENSASSGKIEFQTEDVTSHKIYPTRVLKSSFTASRSRFVPTRHLWSSNYETFVHSSHTTFIRTVLEKRSTFSHQSIAADQFGGSSKSFGRNIALQPTSVSKIKSSEIESTHGIKSTKNGIEWKIVVVAILVPGIVAGIFVPCFVFYCYRRSLKKQRTDRVREEINLAKMNGENSESLVGVGDDTDRLI